MEEEVAVDGDERVGVEGEGRGGELHRPGRCRPGADAGRARLGRDERDGGDLRAPRAQQDPGGQGAEEVGAPAIVVVSPHSGRRPSAAAPVWGSARAVARARTSAGARIDPRPARARLVMICASFVQSGCRPTWDAVLSRARDREREERVESRAMTATRGAALVTGCSTGIGRATALALTGRASPSSRPRGVRRRSPTSRRPASETLALDVTYEESMTAAVRTVEAEHDHVSRARQQRRLRAAGAGRGHADRRRARAVRDERVRTRAAHPAGAARDARGRRHGRIINIGSMGGRFTFPGGGYYHARKHAVEAISDALRLEVAPFGVQVCSCSRARCTSAFVDSAVDGVDTGSRARTPGSGRSSPTATARRTTAGSRPRGHAGEGRRRDRDRRDGEPSRAPGTPSARMAKTLITSRRLLPDAAWDGVIRRVWPTPRPPR